MITSNFLPYIGPCLKWCCLKRRKRQEVYPLHRRYAFLLKTMFTCFTFGFAIPMLYLVAFCVFLTQFILDKLLLTYFYKECVEHNDVLNRVFIRTLKYGVSVYLAFAALTLTMNQCTTFNVDAELLTV